jgi:hypothetical protein
MTLSYEEGGECTRLTYAKFVKGDGEVEDAVAPSALSATLSSSGDTNAAQGSGAGAGVGGGDK